MLRSAIFGLAAASLAGPAMAATYSASLATPTSGRIIARDIVWTCGPSACQGATDYGQSLALCQSLAKRAGRVDSFVANGRALDASQLARCNAVARPTAATASANN